MEWIAFSLRLLLGLAVALGTIFLCYRSVMDSRHENKRMLHYDDEPAVVDDSEATKGQQTETAERSTGRSSPDTAGVDTMFTRMPLSRAGTSFPFILN
jgi:hypothetical protein